ncbi:uncharacterized protein LOC128216686 [Mya arenaria]|uniref:uncharacterized protein LOC128216686 n=1 Tax=Mya arenaria TaxID=6604 RepID=UPI0022E3BDE4|nr:uncharacterized protein LOC128216686 [Mya arenaria]
MYRNYLKQFGYKQTDMRVQDNMESGNAEKGTLNKEHQDKSEINGDINTDSDKEDADSLSNSVNMPFSTSAKQRKLILHFDIRNTVLVADSVTNVSVEQALNSFLTGVTWGREDTSGEWQWHSDQLSLTPPAKDVVTYYKYLEKKFVKNTNDRTLLRLATGDFTHNELGRIFHPHFQNHMELLKWRHEFETERHNILTMSGHDGQQYNYLVPALYKCIYHLVETERDFAIVFRTFGLDAPNVIKSLAHGLQGHHPGFKEPVELPVDENIGTVKRSATAPTVATTSGADGTKTFTGDREIYDMLSQRVGISGFRDDVHYWLENNYHHHTSKPLIIDPFDQNVHHIFFDDNYRTYEDDSIVDVRMFESRGASEARSLLNVETAQFENVCVVQADLIKCIEDENYYKDRVAECETNYSEFLKRWRKLSRSMSVREILL